MKKIKKAIFPVAGLGTRFLPATKAMPKEMLTVVDKPLIQYAVEEAFDSGIEQIIFITGKGKASIQNHFSYAHELEFTLINKNKKGILKEINKIIPKANPFVYVVQNKALGLGHAIGCAKNIINDEPFAVLLADELLKGKRATLLEMIKIYNETGSNVVATMEVNQDDVNQYGILDIESKKNNTIKVKDLVEKPELNKAPSNFAIIGRYILMPEIMDILQNQKKGKQEEIQLTDAMKTLIKKQNLYAYMFKGDRFDCGSKEGFQLANFAYAIEDTVIRKKLMPMVKKFIKEKDIIKE